MRLIAFILLLFFGSLTPAFCAVQALHIDTAKHIVKKPHIKHLRPDRPKPLLPDDKLYYRDCVFTYKYSIAERLKKYPFSKAAKILAISYNGSLPPVVDVIIGEDTTKKPKTKPPGLLIHKDTLDTASVFELRQLTPEQISRLTNMMFNTDIKVHSNLYDYASPGSMCFDPRNAFVFIDKNGKVFDYIEVCFQCKGTKSKSGKIQIDNCNQSLDMTKKFLIDLGIKFGTLTINPADMK